VPHSTIKNAFYVLHATSTHHTDMWLELTTIAGFDLNGFLLFLRRKTKFLEDVKFYRSMCRLRR